MCSVRVPGDMILATKYAKWLDQSLSALTHKVIRTKIEIPLAQYENWLRDEQEGGSALYLECHIRIDSSKQQSLTLDKCKENGLAISHSILKGNFWATRRLTSDYMLHLGKANEPIHTERYPGHGGSLALVGNDVYLKPNLEYGFQMTHDALKTAGLPLIDMHSEAVLVDSNPDLDKGWVNFDLQKGYVAA